MAPTSTELLPGRTVSVRRRRRWLGRILLLVLLVAVGLGGYHGIHGVVTNFGSPSCRAVALGKPVSFTPEQMANAATITAVAVQRHLPARAATIALATAIQESKLRNITYGDKDSLGLFQQRTSQGWGTTAQILDPVHASNAFYDALVKIKGYRSMAITEVAQKVQRSAFPAAYAEHEQEGRVLASVLSGLSPGGLGCRLDPPDRHGSGAAVAAQLRRELGVSATSSTSSAGLATVTVSTGAGSTDLALAAAAWAVAHADSAQVRSVSVGGRTWTRSRNESAWSWHSTTQGGSASSATTVQIQLG